MAKKKPKEDDVQKEVKPFKITSASIVDDMCNYSFEITDGVGLGDTHSVKGKGIIYSDLSDAFRQLNAHLAVIDDVFFNTDTKVVSPKLMENDVFTALYNVSAFQIKGSDEDESVILIGTKHVNSITSRNDIKTSKISLGEFSAYKHAKELKEAIENCRQEVELYKEGKCTALEPIEPEDTKQTKIEFTAEVGSDGDEEFKSAKV
jgi:hypothetical protein